MQVKVELGHTLLQQANFPCLCQTWNTGYLPLSVNAVFDRFGSEYNITAVLTPELSLDFEAYHAYSPVYLPTTYATVYFIAFALASASLVHTAIYHGPAMVATLKDIRKAQTDIHAKLMLKYKAVPVWWFLIIFVASIAMAIGLIEVSTVRHVRHSPPQILIAAYCNRASTQDSRSGDSWCR